MQITVIMQITARASSTLFQELWNCPWSWTPPIIQASQPVIHLSAPAGVSKVHSCANIPTDQKSLLQFRAGWLGLETVAVLRVTQDQDAFVPVDAAVGDGGGRGGSHKQLLNLQFPPWDGSPAAKGAFGQSWRHSIDSRHVMENG